MSISCDGLRVSFVYARSGDEYRRMMREIQTLLENQGMDEKVITNALIGLAESFSDVVKHCKEATEVQVSLALLHSDYCDVRLAHNGKPASQRRMKYARKQYRKRMAQDPKGIGNFFRPDYTGGGTFIFDQAFGRNVHPLKRGIKFTAVA